MKNALIHTLRTLWLFSIGILVGVTLAALSGNLVLVTK